MQLIKKSLSGNDSAVFLKVVSQTHFPNLKKQTQTIHTQKNNSKTCSCPYVQYFHKLFWDDITIIWNENIVYFFK